MKRKKKRPIPTVPAKLGEFLGLLALADDKDKTPALDTGLQNTSFKDYKLYDVMEWLPYDQGHPDNWRQNSAIQASLDFLDQHFSKDKEEHHVLLNIQREIWHPSPSVSPANLQVLDQSILHLESIRAYCEEHAQRMVHIARHAHELFAQPWVKEVLAESWAGAMESLNAQFFEWNRTHQEYPIDAEMLLATKQRHPRPDGESLMVAFSQASKDYTQRARLMRNTIELLESVKDGIVACVKKYGPRDLSP